MIFVLLGDGRTVERPFAVYYMATSIDILTPLMRNILRESHFAILFHYLCNLYQCFSGSVQFHSLIFVVNVP